MITIKNFVFNSFQENTYVLYDETKECVIIDAGCYFEGEQQALKSFINENDLKPVKLLNTHCHVDHLFGNKYVADEFQLSVTAHKEDAFLIDNAVAHGMSFGITVDQPPQVGDFVEEEDEITFGNSKLKVLHVPGHSPGGLAFYNEEQKFVFVGDSLFAGSIGRTDLPAGDYDTLIGSIKSKLMSLGDDVVVYTGHGPATTIGDERKNNPFLQ